MRQHATAGVIALLFVLIGCAPDTPESEPSEASASAEVSTDEGSPVVPDVLGLPVDAATAALEATGFDYEIREVEADGGEVGTVLSVGEPSEGTSVTLDVGVATTVTIRGTYTLTGYPQSDATIQEDGTEECLDPFGEERECFVGTECRGTGGYQDFQTAAPVTVTSPSGEVVALSRTGSAEWVPFGIREDPYYDRTLVVCHMEFEIESPTLDIYEIGIGNRSGLRYSHAELEAQGFQLELSLG